MNDTNIRKRNSVQLKDEYLSRRLYTRNNRKKQMSVLGQGKGVCVWSPKGV